MIIDERTVIDASLRGDLSAQRSLFRRHRGVLRQTFARYGFDDADVAELEQRVWLRLLGPRRALATYSGAGSFCAWLRTIAFNEARSELRRRRSTKEAHDIDRMVAIACDTLGPERSAIKQEKRALVSGALQEVLDDLADDDRRLLVGWAEGATTLSLAKMHDVHRSSMSRRLAKLRKRVGARLRAILWEHYGRGCCELSLSGIELAGSPLG